MTSVTDPSVPTAARVAIVTLGCGRNEVDSDQLAGVLHRDGYTLVDDPSMADAVLVNTCTFIAPAKEESIETILAACDLKGAGVRAVLVVGCMAQRYPDELAEAIPEADAIVGFDAYPRLPSLLGEVLAGRPMERVQATRPAAPEHRTFRPSLPLLVMPTEEPPPETALDVPVTTPQDDLDRVPASGPRFPLRRYGSDEARPPWAYLKIASGCDRVCTFCAIPSFRGRFRSRPPDEIVAEARWLSGQGARELVLVSENTTSWGKDIGGRELQPRLLEQLTAIDGVEQVRLMYLQPAELQRPLVEAMAANPKVASYFDLSLQHVSASVLGRMARSGSPERFAQLIADIRALDPDAVFRSNFILGFPGETDDDVAALERFLWDVGLDWVGLFAYSDEDGTAATSLDRQIPSHEAQRRVAHLAPVVETVMQQRAERFIGRVLDVTVQGSEAGVCVARSFREAPDTDGEIGLVGPDGARVELPAGRRVSVHVAAADGVDLVATVDAQTA
ncbi:MAG: 30S ribosomal protein S12 methylthiotransferase RimO [Actinobacteria bacterium]|nr:30S ribosomal protein S12 methylthiotransferase RimO [Actinomycetota bacterium]